MSHYGLHYQARDSFMPCAAVAHINKFPLNIMGDSYGRHARSAKKIDFSVAFFHNFILLSKDLIEMYKL